MARESFKNFASTTLSASITSSSTSFTVASGGGANFPTSNFVVNIDTEMIFVSSRSSDTFTVGTRGYDGSTAASHSSGATVQLTMCAYTFNHIWSNVPDTYMADVPPTQQPLSSTGVPSGSASASDKEFEVSTNWTLFPSPATGAIFNIHTSLQSNLLFVRGTSDNTLYTAYASFTSASAFTATCKLSTGINMPLNGSQTVETHFFFSDQSNPTGSAESGNRFRIDVVSSGASTSGMVNAGSHIIRAYKDVSGVGTPLTPSLPVSMAVPLYLRITSNGSGTWQAYVGDGITFTLLASVSGLSITLASVGFQFISGATGGNVTQQQCAIDFLRFTLGAVQPPYSIP